MQRGKIILFSGVFMLLASLFLFSGAGAQANDDFRMKKISADIGRDKLQMRKAQDAMKETEDEIKRTQGAIKESQDKEKDALDKIKQDRLSVERAQDSMKQAEAVIRQREKPAAGVSVYDAELLQQNILKILLVLSVILFIYFSARMLTREKEVPPEAQKDLLAKVENWVFLENELKKYLDKLKLIADPKMLDINSQDFKKNFVRDLMLTEILFRVSSEFHKDQELELRGSENDPLFNLERLQSQDYSAYIQKYKASLQDADRAYSTYYKALFFLVLFANRVDEAKSFEIYKKYLLIKELIEDSEGNIVVPEEKIKEYVDRFISREKVFLRTE